MIGHVDKVKITITVDRQISEAVTKELISIGIKKFYTEAARTSILEEKEGMCSFISRRRLAYSPAINITFFTGEEFENTLLSYLAAKFDFNAPGKGVIFSSNLTWIKSHPLCSGSESPVKIAFAKKVHIFKELQGLCCIVSRGQGDGIAGVCLDAGAGVPVVTFGTGGGLRDKLGLLRITIPAEKELVNLVMSRYDIDSLMEIIIDEGKMDEPGKGFIYTYQVKKGIVDTKISRGRRGQVASIEKIVSAIDSIKGTMEWRKSRLDKNRNKRRAYLKNFCELVLICDEGYSIPLMKAAMESGATGSTISKIHYHCEPGGEKQIPSTRQMCRMVVSQNKVRAVAAAIEQAGAFEEKGHALLYYLPVPKAFTYNY